MHPHSLACHVMCLMHIIIPHRTRYNGIHSCQASGTLVVPEHWFWRHIVTPKPIVYISGRTIMYFLQRFNDSVQRYNKNTKHQSLDAKHYPQLMRRNRNQDSQKGRFQRLYLCSSQLFIQNNMSLSWENRYLCESKYHENYEEGFSIRRVVYILSLFLSFIILHE